VGATQVVSKCVSVVQLIHEYACFSRPTLNGGFSVPACLTLKTIEGCSLSNEGEIYNVQFVKGFTISIGTQLVSIGIHKPLLIRQIYPNVYLQESFISPTMASCEVKG
jgi:hypothetical protein